ncbi:MAG TPA: phage major capsid protein [Terriglobia bacterium]|nr:phage major capsid protein [Terriglobia bacterium]
MGQRYTRHFELQRAKLDAEKRTVPLAFSSEHPVHRSDDDLGDFDEVLDHDPENVDLSRLKDGGPFLDMHNLDRQIGVVESASVDPDKMGRAVVRFSKSSPLAEQIFQDVKDGIRKHVSVGYELTKVLSRAKGENGRDTIRFAWAPYEISSVSAPEDPNVGIGRGRRAMQHQAAAIQGAISALDTALGAAQAMPDRCRAACQVALTACENCAANLTPGAAEVCFDECCEAVSALRALSDEYSLAAAAACSAAAEVCYQVFAGSNRSVDESKLVKRAKLKNFMPEPKEADKPNIIELQNKSRDDERKRVKLITASADAIIKNFPEAAEKLRAMGVKAVEEGKSSEDFNAELLAAIPGVRPVRKITAEGLGMSRRDIDTYSLGRAIQSVLTNNGRLDGLEGEIHAEMCKRSIGVTPAGFWVPPDIMLPDRPRNSRGRRMQRDLNVTTFGQGGAMVQTTIMTPIIELLRNRMVCNRLGTQSLAGLEGNVAIPRQSGAATAFALPESATLTKSTQAIEQILLTPRRVGAWNDYTKQLLLQSSVDVENFIRDDLLKGLAIKWDYMILQGQGANSEPTGIMNTAGIGSVVFGATATWAKVISFETALALANADAGNMAYVTTPAVRGAWKAIAKIGSTFPIFIWEAGDWADDSNDGEVNGYRAAATNQILNNAVAFGNWEDCIGPALWGGYDVVVNPYSRDTDGVVRVTVNTFGDVAVRHAPSFCWSMDAGNQ